MDDPRKDVDVGLQLKTVKDIQGIPHDFVGRYGAFEDITAYFSDFTNNIQLLKLIIFTASGPLIIS